MVEEGFFDFTTKEKESCILLIAETVFILSTLVTIEVTPQAKRKRYSPQGGTLSFHFGGGTLQNKDAFGGLKDNSPDPTPGVTVKRYSTEPKKKDKYYPF